MLHSHRQITIPNHDHISIPLISLMNWIRHSAPLIFSKMKAAHIAISRLAASANVVLCPTSTE